MRSRRHHHTGSSASTNTAAVFTGGILLAPIYGWFTEGFDTPDLKDAKALLDKLASAPLGSRARPRHHSAAPVNNPG